MARETLSTETTTSTPPMVCVDDVAIVDRFQQVDVALTSLRNIYVPMQRIHATKLLICIQLPLRNAGFCAGL